MYRLVSEFFIDKKVKMTKVPYVGIIEGTFEGFDVGWNEGLCEGSIVGIFEGAEVGLQVG